MVSISACLFSFSYEISRSYLRAPDSLSHMTTDAHDYCQSGITSSSDSTVCLMHKAIPESVSYLGGYYWF